MTDTKLAVTHEIEARCTKCRANTNHIIVAMMDDKPAKVQCNTCMRQHKYRPPSVKKTTRQVPAGKSADQKRWEQLCTDTTSETVKSYSMNTSFKVDSLVDHPVFGIGVVQQLVGMRKVEILFESGLKLMRCK